MKLFWTENARQDLLSIKQYIATDNPTAANHWIERLKARARNTLLTSPFAGRKVPELLRDDIRELIEGNYRIVYHILEDSVVVLTVFESHRLFPIEIKSNPK